MPDKKENKLFSFIDSQINPDHYQPEDRKTDQGYKCARAETIKIINSQTK